jgi:hypothetical protein
MLRYYKKNVTTDSVLTAYNMGIGAVVKGKVATEYVKAYERASKSGRGIPSMRVAPGVEKMPALSNLPREIL